MRKVGNIVLVALLAVLVGPSSSNTQGPLSKVSSGGAIGLKLVAEGLTSPLTLVPPPDASGRLFIVDQIGLIRILMPDGTLREDPFLDLRDKIVDLNPPFDERGLLGLAFHPAYASNGRFFVYYSAPLRKGAPPDWNHTAHISEFAVSGDPNAADPGSERIILQVDQPQFNHDGGTVAFGPDDGFLYISLGDGGGGRDVGTGHPPIGNGQDITTLLGNILRIDVDSGTPYGIPPGNPFVGVAGRDEIFAYGFRNPYRFSFDMEGNHELFVGDAGQALWEEVDLVTLGGNYGWNIREGTHCFDPNDPNTSPPECPSTGYLGEPLLGPIIEYANSRQPGGVGRVVVGGYVYRGRAVPQLRGRYVFGDWSTGFREPDGSLLFAKRPGHGTGLWRVQQLRVVGNPGGRLGRFVLGFGQDEDGEMYVGTTENVGPTGDTGKVFKIVRPGG